MNWTKQDFSHVMSLDLGPLVRIKQALTRLKQEVQQMEVRIGVVSLMLFVLHSPTSFPVSLFFLLPGDGKKRDPGNEIAHSFKLCLETKQLQPVFCFVFVFNMVGLSRVSSCSYKPTSFPLTDDQNDDCTYQHFRLTGVTRG